jgi:hypothetical protein
VSGSCHIRSNKGIASVCFYRQAENALWSGIVLCEAGGTIKSEAPLPALPHLDHDWPRLRFQPAAGGAFYLEEAAKTEAAFIRRSEQN